MARVAGAAAEEEVVGKVDVARVVVGGRQRRRSKLPRNVRSK